MATNGRLSLLVVGLCLGGCNPIYYSPNTQNVLIAPSRGDLSASAAADGNRAELQAAYAITDAVAVQLNGGIFEPDELENGDGGSGKFLEVGAGYFAPLRGSFAWEIHALFGAGSFENHFPSTVDENPGTAGEISADLVRFGFQPAIGYRSRYVEAAVSSRLLGLAYRNIEGALVYDEQDQVEALRDGGSYFLFEPALTLRAGLPRAKLQLQTTRSINLSDRDFRQDESMLTIGVVVDIPTRR
jgi:hypothetical protein